MKKTKMYIIFAVFAAALMLMTPTMAGPIQEEVTLETIEQRQQEEVTLETIEQRQQELINSIEKLFIGIENDQELNTLVEQLSKDTELNQISNLIERTEDTDEKNALTSDYITALKNKPEYNDLKNYINSEYSAETANIERQIEQLLEAQGEIENPEQELLINQDELLLQPCGVVGGAMYTVTFSPDGTMEISGPSTSVGTAYTVGGGINLGDFSIWDIILLIEFILLFIYTIVLRWLFGPPDWWPF